MNMERLEIGTMSELGQKRRFDRWLVTSGHSQGASACLKGAERIGSPTQIWKGALAECAR